MSANRSWALAGFWLLLLLSSGCDFPARLSAEWSALKAVMTGKASPLAKDPKRAEAERIVREKAEILQEMIRVVFRQEPADEFSGLLEALASGATVEGIYNGLVSSSRYRNLEKAESPAATEALGFFCEQMAWIQRQRRVPKIFRESDARPLPEPVPPGLDAPLLTPAPQRSAITAHDFQELFAGAGSYTLKRVLASELLDLLARDASWYGAFAAATSSFARSQGIPLGLVDRERTELDFHESWARSAGSDRLAWETLNRVHRLLNGPYR